MAGFPKRQRQIVVPDSTLQEEVDYTATTNNDHFVQTDNDPDADYATQEEFDAYTDPDSIRSIFREEFEKFYVPTTEKKTAQPLRYKKINFADLYSPLQISFTPITLYGVACFLNGSAAVRVGFFDEAWYGDQYSNLNRDSMLFDLLFKDATNLDPLWFPEPIQLPALTLKTTFQNLTSAPSASPNCRMTLFYRNGEVA